MALMNEPCTRCGSTGHACCCRVCTYVIPPVRTVQQQAAYGTLFPQTTASAGGDYMMNVSTVVIGEPLWLPAGSTASAGHRCVACGKEHVNCCGLCPHWIPLR